MGKVREISDHLDLQMTRNGQIVVDQNAPNPIDRDAEGLADKGCVVPRRPNFYPTRNKFVAYLDACVGQVGRVHAGANFHAKIGKLFQRARR